MAGTYTISKEFSFSCSHVLDGLREGHQCARVHGHNIVVRVELWSEKLDQAGMVLDYGDLRMLGVFLDETFDHRHLNEVVPFNPTAENMAAYLFRWCWERGWPVARVGWSETPKTWAFYEA